MSVHLYAYRETGYVRVHAPYIDVTYRVGPMGFLQRVFMVDDLSPYQVAQHNMSDEHVPIVAKVKAMFEKVAEAAFIITERLNWDDVEGVCDFAKRVSEVYKDPKYTEIDLRNLSLERLPFPMARFVRTRKLDLRHNELRALPIDLVDMKELKEVDLRDNPISELPMWCSQLLSHVKIRLSGPQVNPDDWAQTP